MKDFPVFTTEHGVASLILKEIPYRQEAYIRIQDTAEPEALLEDCIGFCRACGALRIYGAGHSILEKNQLHTSVIEMRSNFHADPDQIENLWPVTSETVSQWRLIHNQAMKAVDNSGTLETKDEAELLSAGGAYFVHKSGTLLGIGWIRENRLMTIAAVQKGMGQRVLHTLLSAVPDETVVLEVASSNKRAIALYERNGFVQVREISRWYKL